MDRVARDPRSSMSTSAISRPDIAVMSAESSAEVGDGAHSAMTPRLAVLERLEGRAGGVGRKRLLRSGAAPRATSRRLGLPSRLCRVTATARPCSGCIDDTGQSLPKLMCAPGRRDGAIGYCNADRAGPEPRHASARPSSGRGRPRAARSSRSRRGRRTAVGRHGSTSCVWAITGRRSRRPFARGGVLDRVERPADPAVADGVDVDLEPVGVEGGHRLCQLLREPSSAVHRCAVRRRTARGGSPVPISMTPSAKNFIVPALQVVVRRRSALRERVAALPRTPRAGHGSTRAGSARKRQVDPRP